MSEPSPLLDWRDPRDGFDWSHSQQAPLGPGQREEIETFVADVWPLGQATGQGRGERRLHRAGSRRRWSGCSPKSPTLIGSR